MNVRRSYKFPIYPKKGMQTRLEQTLSSCCFLYNSLLNKRNAHYKETGKTLSCFDCNKLISLFSLNYKLYSRVAQDVSIRLDLAYQAFFRRVKEKNGKAGFPRFKSASRYDSFTYSQSGFKLVNNKLHLSKIGDIKINLHRKMEGKIKTLTIKREGVKWYAVFSCELEVIPTVKPETKAVGVDVGCIDFVTLSNGESVKNPHYLRVKQEELSKAQSKYSKLILKPKDDKQKIKAKHQLVKLHNKVANQRKDFLHKLSRQMVEDYSHICIEDIKPSQMLKEGWRALNRSILDSGWVDFRMMLHYKAVEAGCVIAKVNPAYTSQICSQCGVKVKKELSERMHNCPTCGLSLSRDINAARNILRIGMDSCSV